MKGRRDIQQTLKFRWFNFTSTIAVPVLMPSTIMLFPRKPLKQKHETLIIKCQQRSQPDSLVMLCKYIRCYGLLKQYIFKAASMRASFLLQF